MTLTKAIELLTMELEAKTRTGEIDLHDALKLGIEALKRLKEHRHSHIDITYRALPGETAE